MFWDCQLGVSALVRNVYLPPMMKVHQVFDRHHIERTRIRQEIYRILSAKTIQERLLPGKRIAITASSRGIANADQIMRGIVDFVKARGSEPFIVPAMGSHGGADAAAQAAILAEYGITEASMGCRIQSSMAVKKIGVDREGRDVFIDKYAAEADGIIVNCRVKPHTAFRGPYESGIMKMMAIGLGNQVGADVCHQDGFRNFAKNIPMIGTCVLQNAPVLFAVATIDNAYGQTHSLTAVPAEDIQVREPELLKTAFTQMPRILLDQCDVLVVDEIGKNISGDGMDPNVTGTFATPYAYGGIQAQRVAVLGLAPSTHGNAMGLGYADATTRAVAEALDLNAMYINAITSTTLQGVVIPLVMANAREAVQVCLKCCEGICRENPRIVRITNTLQLEYIQVSRAFAKNVTENSNLEPLSDWKEIDFADETY